MMKNTTIHANALEKELMRSINESVIEEGVNIKEALKNIDKARNLLFDASLLIPSKEDEMSIHQRKVKEGLENMIKLTEELFKNIKRYFG